MHELSIIQQIVTVVEEVKEENNLDQIDTLVLQIGDRSGIIPDFLLECWKVMKSETSFSNMKIQVEEISGREFLIKEIIVP